MTKPAKAGAPGHADATDRRSLTDQILDQFRKTLIDSGALDEAKTAALLRIARGQAKPKAKDVELLLSLEEPLE